MSTALHADMWEGSGDDKEKPTKKRKLSQWYPTHLHHPQNSNEEEPLRAGTEPLVLHIRVFSYAVLNT